MSITILIPTPLRPSVKNQRSIIIESAATIVIALKQLATEYPELERYLFDDQGNVRGYINYYINDKDCRDDNGVNSCLNEGDVLSIVPAIAGGLL